MKLDGYLSPGSCIHGPSAGSTPEPKAGAQCANAHAGICAGGGPNPSWRRPVPTATVAENGRFKLKRVTSKKRMRAKLRAVKTELMHRRHLPIPEQGEWLGRVVRGHCAYYAVPDNNEAVRGFRTRVVRHWRHALRRRSQRAHVTWERMYRLEARWIPPARVQHPWPKARFDARTQGRSPVR